MKNILTLPNVLIMVLISILIYQNIGPAKKPEIIKVDGKPYEVIKWKIDTQFITKETVIKKPGKTIIKDTTIYVDVPANVDTNNILKDYFAKNVYKDTLKLNDSLGYVFISDTISQNTILYRNFKSIVREKIITDEKIVKELPKTQVYIGLDAQFTKNDFMNGLGAGLLLKNKKDQIYSFGLGITNDNLQPYFRFGYHKKLSFKK